MAGAVTGTTGPLLDGATLVRALGAAVGMCGSVSTGFPEISGLRDSPEPGSLVRYLNTLRCTKTDLKGDQEGKQPG